MFEYMQYFDLLIMTHYTGRTVQGAGELIQSVLDAGKDVVVVANSPLIKDTPSHWPSVVCSYGVMSPLLKVAADLICGERQ